MSILIDVLPEWLEICEQKCNIRTDFRTWLKFSKLMSESENDLDKLSEMFKLVFFELPPNMMSAIGEMLKFYQYQNVSKGQEKSSAPSKRLFDFDYDGDLIYSAFLQQYHIDLCDTSMHWWKFRALFNSLSEDTQFMRVVSYRNTNLAKIKDKEQKAFYRKMKELYRLPDARSEAQKEADFNDIFANQFI